MTCVFKQLRHRPHTHDGVPNRHSAQRTARAVGVVEPCDPVQARSLRWKQMVLRALKSAVISPPATAAVAAADTGPNSAVSAAYNTTAAAAAAAAVDALCAEGCRLCSASETWASTAVICMLCAVAAVHAGLCAAVRGVAGARAPGWASGVLAGGKLEAGAALVVLPGAPAAVLRAACCAWASVTYCGW